jgi:hypothetical protein
MPKGIPVVALMYDFDKTLCTKDMQEYSFIPSVNLASNAFWGDTDQLAKKQKMDKMLAYMFVMLDKARAAKKPINRNSFVSMGRELELFPGVLEWFSRINAFGKSVGVRIEHYIISSGLREIIEGSSIFGEFKDVFACEFLYDENGVACWPKNVVNYTTKTQFLFRINKGVLDLSNDIDLNRFTPEEERVVPFRNMLYIGDGLTDVPCMRLVKANGGFSIAVYPGRRKETVEELLLHERIDYIARADYSEGSELDTLVKAILSKMSGSDWLYRRTKEQLEKAKKENG